MKKDAYRILIEVSDDGAVSGKDPRKLSIESLNLAGHYDAPLLEVIREKCLNCCGNMRNEVASCTAVSCTLWPYRMNKNPFRKRELSDEQRAILSERFKKSKVKNV